MSTLKLKEEAVSALKLHNVVSKRGYLSPLINGKIYSGATYDRENDQIKTSN